MAHQVAARLSFEPLQDIMNELARYGLSESDEPRKSLGPGIKSTVRAREKIENDYKGDCTRLKDAIRFTIYASDINDFRVCCEGAEVMERDGRIHIKLVKNRFIGKSAPGGYRDGNFVFELLETECLVEMQILIVETPESKNMRTQATRCAGDNFNVEGIHFLVIYKHCLKATSRLANDISMKN